MELFEQDFIGSVPPRLEHIPGEFNKRAHAPAAGQFRPVGHEHKGLRSYKAYRVRHPFTVLLRDDEVRTLHYPGA